MATQQQRYCSIESTRFSYLAEITVDNTAVTLVPHPEIPGPDVRTSERAYVQNGGDKTRSLTPQC